MKILYKIIFFFILTIFISIPTYSSNKAEKSIKTSLIADPSAQITGDAKICLNATEPAIKFEVQGDNNAPYTFTYTKNGLPETPVVTQGNDKSITVQAPTNVANTFTYVLTGVKDKDNNDVNIDTSKNTVIITVTAKPTVDFTFADNQCSGTPIQFTSTISGNPSFNYTWNFGDGSTSSEQNPTHTFNAPFGCLTSNYVVSLTITDANGCSTTVIKNITIKQLPDIDFTDPANLYDPFNNCSSASSSNPNLTITVNNSSSSTCITSFSINWGDGSVQNNASFPASHTYTRLGAFDMVITAIGANGCVNSKTYKVKNESNPAGSLSSPGSTTNLCAPTPDLAFAISSWGNNSPTRFIPLIMVMVPLNLKFCNPH